MEPPTPNTHSLHDNRAATGTNYWSRDALTKNTIIRGLQRNEKTLATTTDYVDVARTAMKKRLAESDDVCVPQRKHPTWSCHKMGVSRCTDKAVDRKVCEKSVVPDLA